MTKKMDYDNQNNTFSDARIFELCEAIMENHRALNVIGMIFSEFDFNNNTGNAFQGKIQKNWFKSVIHEMMMSQVEKAELIIDIYTQKL